MRLVACDKSILEKSLSYRRSKFQILLDEFVNSDMKCAKIEDWDQVSASALQCALNRAIKRYNIGGVRAVMCKGEIYLVKK